MTLEAVPCSWAVHSGVRLLSLYEVSLNKSINCQGHRQAVSYSY